MAVVSVNLCVASLRTNDQPWAYAGNRACVCPVLLVLRWRSKGIKNSINFDAMKLSNAEFVNRNAGFEAHPKAFLQVGSLLSSS